jgi:hypothetical protein
MPATCLSHGTGGDRFSVQSLWWRGTPGPVGGPLLGPIPGVAGALSLAVIQDFFLFYR